MMDETDNENEDEDEDEDEGEEEEGENDDKEKDDGEKEVRSKPAACTPDTSFADTQVDELQNDTCAQPVGYHLHLLRAAGSAERVTQPASDSQALANANADAYDVKFSTELMIPMRRHTTRNNAPWEPGMLHLAGLSDRDYALARWPDGYQAALPDKVEYIKGLSRAGGSTNSDEPRTWTHIVTNHTIYVKQRIDRHLLVSIDEKTSKFYKSEQTLFVTSPTRRPRSHLTTMSSKRQSPSCQKSQLTLQMIKLRSVICLRRGRSVWQFDDQGLLKIQ